MQNSMKLYLLIIILKMKKSFIYILILLKVYHKDMKNSHFKYFITQFFKKSFIDFPIFSKIVKFFDYPDSLVRTTTFNIILTLLKCKLKRIF